MENSLFRLDGEVAIVTGAGIGKTIARAVAADIRAAGGRATGVPCDVTKETDL